MSTKRDLVEAHAFSRRRLVTAFLSGAPGGREVEPVRPGRALVGGIALSVLLLAGAAIAGFFRPPTPADWREPGMVISKERGTPYVILESGDSPRRLVNVTSGMLILGAGYDLRTVKQDEINKYVGGDSIGIFGAPDDPPESEALVSNGWTSCAVGGAGMRLRIDDDPRLAIPAPSGAAVVRSSGADATYYLVVQTDRGARRLALPGDEAPRTAITNALRGVEELGTVSPAWLNLVPEGAALDLTSFPVSGGGAADYMEAGFSVGDVVEASGQLYLLGADGPMPLDPFAELIYGALGGSSEHRSSGPMTTRTVAAPNGWPGRAPAATDLDPTNRGANELCVVMATSADTETYAVLATAPVPEASAAEVAEGIAVDVATARGAYVLGADHGDRTGGQPWLIDSSGRRYPLGGPAGETAASLGYGSYDPPTVPDAWIELIGSCGPELSRELALGTPDLAQQQMTCG
ncbi:type VII secretion protein EccB [Nocardioides sp. Bht2]|uniref:type VII secretion protein EccB n=1 Tax=Nocardioides sp. Bht2 TaxID=3392297 RepID=UPI0039B522C3